MSDGNNHKPERIWYSLLPQCEDKYPQSGKLMHFQDEGFWLQLLRPYSPLTGATDPLSPATSKAHTASAHWEWMSQKH